MEADDGFVNVTEDGGVAKKIIKEGEGDLPLRDGTFKVKVIITVYYVDPVKGSKRVVYEPTDAVPELKVGATCFPAFLSFV